MAVFAHPDDETFGAGGTLAYYASLGCRVVLVTATKGEAGEIQDTTMKADEPITEIRQRELRCACEILGLEGPIYLGYRDSGMSGAPDNEHPSSFLRADLDEATGKVVSAIRQCRPQVVVTFEPGGGYGHPDHIKVHQVTTRAFHLAGDPTRYPEQGLPPWQPKKLYYTALPRKLFRAMAERMRQEGIDLGTRGFDAEKMGMADELITTEIDVSAVLDKKAEAFRCHRSQLSPNGLIAQLSTESMSEFMRTEYFWRMVPEAPPSNMERDLFEGL